MKRVLFKSLITLALILGIAAPVWAHGVIVQADPPIGGAVAEAPSQVKVWFSEPFDPAFSGLEVYAIDSQQRVDLGDVQIDPDGALVVGLKPDLPQGAYIVTWRIFTPSDGHQTSGSYSFGVGVPAGQGETLATERTPIGDASRFLWLSGLALFVGIAFFRWAVRLPDDSILTRRLFWPVQYVRVGLGLGVLGALYVQTQALQAGVLDVLSTSWGAAWLAKAVMAGVVIARANWLMRDRALTPGLLAGSFLTLAAAFTSHSAARFGWVGVLTDFAHVLAASVWVGGIACAAILLINGERKFLTNFSILATAAIGLLVASGAWLAANQIGSWAGLLFTDYGRALILKLAVAPFAFGMGAINALRANRTVSILETTAGLGVVLCAAILTNLPPAYSQPTDSAPTRVQQTKSVSGIEATVELWPARRGSNTIEVTLDSTGEPVTDGQVRAQFVPVSVVGSASPISSELALPEVGGGTYSASGPNLTSEGQWQLLLVVNEEHFLNFEYSVGPDGAVRAPASDEGLLVQVVGWLNQYALILAAGLLLVGAGVWSALAWRSLQPLAAMRATQVVWTIWLVPGFLLAGAILLGWRLLF